MAQAGARFADSLLKATQGEKNVIEPTFVDSPLYKDQGIEFVASNVRLGPNGVEEILPIGKVSEYEQKLLENCLVELKKNIQKGTLLLMSFVSLYRPRLTVYFSAGVDFVKANP